jgi:pimeloyl-ACP methyl ester carboxylesterase
MKPSSVARGIGALVFDAIEQATHIVEGVHATIAAAPLPFGPEPERAARGVSGLVYGGVRLVNESARAVVDRALRVLSTDVEPALSRPEWDAVRSAVNGVLGDHLVASGNPLAIPMSFRRGGQSLPTDRARLAAAVPGATDRLLVLVHGLCMSDRQWRRRGHDHGATLERDLGYTAVYLHYNSGRHVSENGRELAENLETLVAAWPVALREVAIVAHSMGGLVARSACCYAPPESRWRDLLRAIVFLGTPHHGAPLERGGNWLQTLVAVSPYTAPLSRLGAIRSSGITDLRYGNVVDEDWNGADRFRAVGDRRSCTPLPSDVACFTIAATLGDERSGVEDRLLGDGLVPVASALGDHPRTPRALEFPEGRRWTGYGMNHWDLLDRPEVYAKLVEWLREPRTS